MKVLVTGSSSLLVEKGLKESLAGRFELIRTDHWNFNEAKEAFHLPLRDFIEFGCYPGAVPFIDDLSQKMQGSLQNKGSVPTLSNYLQLLSDAFLVTPVQKHSPSALRSKRSIPKLITHDNGLIRAFERPIKKRIPAERFGRYLEAGR